MSKLKKFPFLRIEESEPIRHPWAVLVIIYVLSVAVHLILSFSFLDDPTISIDESLYINIAKSLAAGEGIMYRSQPVPYMYILYPLLLVPLYLFPLPFDLYRVIQVYNSLLMATSVFPVYLFAYDFTKNRKKALLASFFTLLIPDIQMGGFLMAECVVWPLSLWLVFFAYRMFTCEKNRVACGVLTGLFTALLFWAKPGSFAMGIVLLFSSLFLLRGSNQKKIDRRPPLMGILVCFVCIVFFYILYIFAFKNDFTLLGLYKKQLTQLSAQWFAAVAEFSFLQLLLFAIACGGVFFVIPYACLNRYTQDRRAFLIAFSAGLFVTAVGTAAFVDMFGWNGSFSNPQLHLRYMAMYIPVLFVMSLGAPLPEDKPERKKLAAFLLLMAVLMVFPGASVGFVKEKSIAIDALSLSAWMKSDLIPFPSSVLLTVISVLSLCFIAYQLLYTGREKTVKKCCLVFFAFFLLVNNICGCFVSYDRDSDGYGTDAVQMNTIVDRLPQEVLIVTQQQYDDVLSYCLESRIRKPMQQVPSDVFITALAENNGAYIPFIPPDDDPNVGNRLTPDTDEFLFGAAVANCFEWNPSVTLQTSEKGWYTLVQASPNTRIADTALLGLNRASLAEDSKASLYIFDTDRYKNGKLPLSLSVCAKDGSAELIIENAGNTRSINLSSNLNTINFSLLQGDTIITAKGGDIIILSYSTTR